MHADAVDLKQNLAARGEASVGEILDDFMLRVDGDSLSSRQILEIDAVTASPEAQLDSIVDQAFALHPLTHSDLCEQVNRALFQYPSADAFLNVLPAAIFDHDRVNSLQMKKVGKHQTGRSSAHDSDLSA